MSLRRILGWALILPLVTACVADPTPTPSPTPDETPVATATPTAAPTVPATPEPTPEPELSLDLPEEIDARVVSVTVDPRVAADGDGEITVTVTSDATERIDELVLRWPSELSDTLLLAPFAPSDDRIREGGQPLVQEWTKWVIGPGEQGEPEGTISLGWGPLMPGATLTIPIVVTRNSPGPVGFDLHVLARDAILTIDGGEPAALRVEVP